MSIAIVFKRGDENTIAGRILHTLINQEDYHRRSYLGDICADYDWNAPVPQALAKSIEKPIGSVYQTLRKLQTADLIKCDSSLKGDGRQPWYELTREGRRTAQWIRGY